MTYHRGQRKVVITEDDNINHVNSLYDEMRHMRTQLLNRIELLEDDVSRLSQDSMEYDKDLYNINRRLEERIDILTDELTRLKNIYEGQKGSETDY